MLNHLNRNWTLEKIWKKNLKITLNIQHNKEKEICPVYISKINSNREKQITLLIITNVQKDNWHYLVVKKLSALLQRITSKHKGNLFCLSCLYSFRTENLMRVNFMKNNFKIKLFGEL